MIIFGGRASNIGNFNVPYSNCAYCEYGDTQRISVFGKYAHVFWIPIFPVGKKAVSECTHCKRTIEQKDFSPELKALYREHKGAAKRPFWHWLGLIIFGLFFALIASIGGSGGEEDSRSALLKADEHSMTKNPTMESDSISYKISQMFNVLATDEIRPSEFQYLTKIKDDKALVLVRIPKLRKVEKESREVVMEIIESIVDNQADLADKEVYIGVKGLISMMLIKTPSFRGNSRLSSSSHLYEFYGLPEVIEE